MKKSLLVSFVLLAISAAFTLSLLVLDRAGIVAGRPVTPQCTSVCSGPTDNMKLSPTTYGRPRLSCSSCADPTPPDYSLGLSSLNLTLNRALGGYAPFFYKVSKYSASLVFLVPFLLAALALGALRKHRRSLKLFLPLLALYLATGLVYLLFELFPLNFRPLLLSDSLESSFPSSHTLFATTICVSAALFLDAYPTLLPKRLKKFLPLIKFILYALFALVVLTRLASGVHWFTDILGGLLFASTLLMFFYTALRTSPRKK